MDIYRENIIEHYKNPLNHHPMEDATLVDEDLNPLCGDRIKIWVKLDGSTETVESMTFQGNGCAISQATTSMLTEVVPGMSIDEVESISQEDIRELVGVSLSPVRLKCALLGIKVVQAALLKYRANQIKNGE